MGDLEKVGMLKMDFLGLTTLTVISDCLRSMKEKLGVDMPGYRILGACNPPLAHRAIQAEPEIGLLLPCNVTVREAGGGRVVVGFLDPQTMVQLTNNAAVGTVADDAGQRLQRLQRVRSALEGS